MEPLDTIILDPKVLNVFGSGSYKSQQTYPSRNKRLGGSRLVVESSEKEEILLDCGLEQKYILIIELTKRDVPL